MKKRIINYAELAEYQEYLDAMMIYKIEKREWPRFQKFKLQDSTNPMDRLKYFERKARNSLICKAFYAALKKYKLAAARMHLKDKGINLTELDLAQVTGADIPTTVTDMIRQQKEIAKEKAMQNMNSKEFEAMKKAALDYMNKGHKTKDDFLNPLNKENDPTLGDFEPL